MLSTVLAAYLALNLPQNAAEVPLPRPTDEQLVAHFLTERPDARILSQNFTDLKPSGARLGCGLVEVDGVTEPFSVMAAWQNDRSAWRIYGDAPRAADADGDGDTDRHDRELNAHARRIAVFACKHHDPISQPPGVSWDLGSDEPPPPIPISPSGPRL